MQIDPTSRLVKEPAQSQENQTTEVSAAPEPPKILKKRTISEQIHDTIVSVAAAEAAAYNAGKLLTMRRDMKVHFKINRSDERPRLTKSINNFMHCAYQPGPSFINCLNQLNSMPSGQQRGSKGRKMRSEAASSVFETPRVPARADVGFDNQSANGSEAGFRCVTCNRGPPYTKKYAKNQCQTCYKKDKKFQRGEFLQPTMYGGWSGQQGMRPL